MPALTITAANVGVGENANTDIITVGQATNHGVVLYVDTATDSLYKPADADAVDTAKANAISLTSATGTGLPVLVLRNGDLYLGAILTQGVEYYLGTTPGTIVLKSDLASGDYVTRIGIARTTSILEVDIDATGITL